MKIYIRTYGCQMNAADSERMAGVLSGKGYTFVDNEKDADIVLLNTCTVRNLAEQKAWSKLDELHYKNKDKKILGVAGCMAQQYGSKIFNKAPYVNFVCGTNRFSKIGDIIEKACSGSRVIDVSTITEDEYGLDNNGFKRTNNDVCAFVPISRGCNNKCSYCVVPSVRGYERNRPLDEIVSEIESLVKSGCKEVTLLGQNVNSYKEKCGTGKERGFVDLLNQTNEIKGIERIRFVTSHPKDASTDLFEAISKLDKVCEYVHLPIQSGSNNILAKMNRGYTREHYLGLIDKVRKIIPNASISTDIILGFPGETEGDFKETCNLMKQVGFDGAYIFKYSPRPGTAAYEMKDDVSLKIKKERNEFLLKFQEEIGLNRNKLMEGSVQEVLVEGCSETNKDRLMGRTRTNKIVVFTANEDLIGRLVNVKIVDAGAFTSFGEL